MIFKNIKDKLQGKGKKGHKRSSKWRKVRKNYLKDFPICAICEKKKKIEVHHKIPFHVNPKLELVQSNLITLCENKKYGINCHLLMGHFGNYKKYNPIVETDVIKWNKNIKG